MKVYKGQYGWSALCTNDFKGKKSHCYISIQFKKGFEPSGQEESIEVNKFFLSCYEGKNGVQPKIVVQDYVVTREPIRNVEEPFAPEDTSNFGGKNSSLGVSLDINPDDLPFY